MNNSKEQCIRANIAEPQENFCNHLYIDDEMDIWTLLCEGVKEQEKQQSTGKVNYFVEQNTNFP